MDALLNSSETTYWNLQGPEVQIDRHNLITKRIREYTHRGVMYTILACLDVTNPHNSFHELEVKRPLGEDFPVNPDTDFLIVKRLLAYSPITDEQCRTAEEKLYTRLAKRRQQLANSGKTKVNDDATGSVEVNGDADADGSVGGIFGVYCGGSFYRDY